MYLKRERMVTTMKKEEIVALGVEEELAQKIADASADELKGYIPKSRFDEVNEAKKKAEELVKERDGQLEELKKSAGDSEALQKQIEELQEANETAAKKYADDLKQMQIDNAVDKAIAAANGKNPKAIKALLDLSDAKLEDDGTVKGLSAQLEALTKAEDSSFLFNSSVPNVKGMTPGKGKDGAGNEVDFSKMNYEQLTTYLEENPDAKIS